MRAEPAQGRPTPEPAREPAPGFADALRRARDRAGPRRGRAPAPPASPAPGLPASPGSPPGPAPALGPGGPPAPVGRAAAVAAVEVLRRGQRAQVEIAAGAGLRYALGMEAGGVEIRARASPELERAARADLCAVANELRRRGVRLARAEVRLAPPGASGGPGRR